MSHEMSWSTIDNIFAPHTDLRDRMAAAFRAAVAGTASPAKALGRRLGISTRGAELILRGETMPRAETLLAAMFAFDAVWDEVLSIVGREPAAAEQLLDELALRLAERRR